MTGQVRGTSPWSTSPWKAGPSAATCPLTVTPAGCVLTHDADRVAQVAIGRGATGLTRSRPNSVAGRPDRYRTRARAAWLLILTPLRLVNQPVLDPPGPYPKPPRLLQSSCRPLPRHGPGRPGCGPPPPASVPAPPPAAQPMPRAVPSGLLTIGCLVAFLGRLLARAIDGSTRRHHLPPLSHPPVGFSPHRCHPACRHRQRQSMQGQASLIWTYRLYLHLGARRDDPPRD